MSSTSRRFIPGSLPPLAALVAVGALALSACGSSAAAESDATDGLATLETDDGATADDTGDLEVPTDVAVSADESALALSACLRDEGLDVPDIGVDADGNIDLRGLFDGGAPDESFREAMTTCQDLLGGVAFGGGRPGGAGADNTELADALLEFSDCIRAEGFEDIADLTIGAREGGAAPGANADGEAPADGEPPVRGEGTREGGFGDRSTNFAERLGLDPEDPAVIAALDTCSPIIDQAFANAGPGAQPAEGA